MKLGLLLKLIQKILLLNYFRIIEHKLIDMFSIPNINNDNHKDYVHDKLKKKQKNKKAKKEDPRHAKSIFDSFKFKSREQKGNFL